MPGVVMASDGITVAIFRTNSTLCKCCTSIQKGEKYNAVNYRPISLTCISCKIMDHVITKHILNHLENSSLLYDLVVWATGFMWIDVAF
jgi:hypothetical protein